MTENSTPPIDRSIYPMPMFVNLVVADLERTAALYARAGFVTLATIPGPDNPRLLHLRRMRNQDLLVTRGEPAAGSMTVSFAAGDVDLAAVAAELRAAGATVQGPFDTPWFTTDVRFTDPDGTTVVLTARRMADVDAVEEWARDSIRGDFVRPETPDGPRGSAGT